MYGIVLLLIFFVFLLWLTGWFSGTETALTHLTFSSLAVMKKRGEKNVTYLLKLKKNMNSTLIVILICNNVINIILSVLAALLANSIFHALGVTIVVGLMTFLIIIFGEIIPKSHAVHDTERVAINRARTIYYLTIIFTPVLWLFTVPSRAILLLMGQKPKPTQLIVTEESIKSMATLGESEGSIQAIEKDIIYNVFKFADRKTRDIMVPLEKVFCIPVDTSLQRAKKMLAESGFTRIPVVNEKGRIMGILYSKDLLAKKNGSIRSFLRKPMFLTANSYVPHSFHQMIKNRTHIAVITGKKKKNIGIVTLEDILEELVGEIYDEYSQVKHDFSEKRFP